MPEYIEREALLLQIDLHGTNKFGMLDENIREFIKKQPTADVVEVRHGEWIAVSSSDMSIGKAFKCSKCQKMRYGVRLPPYCQECGAKMDGKGGCDEID